MAALEPVVAWCLVAIGLVLTISFAILIKKGDYRNAIRYGGAVVAAILAAGGGFALPDTPHLFVLVRKLSLIPLAITIYLTFPVARRAWELMTRGSVGDER